MAYVEPQHFDDKDIVLSYVAGNTSEARKVEASLTEEGVDYTLAPEAFVHARGGGHPVLTIASLKVKTGFPPQPALEFCSRGRE